MGLFKPKQEAKGKVALSSGYDTASHKEYSNENAIPRFPPGQDIVQHVCDTLRRVGWVEDRAAGWQYEFDYKGHNLILDANYINASEHAGLFWCSIAYDKIEVFNAEAPRRGGCPYDSCRTCHIGALQVYRYIPDDEWINLLVRLDKATEYFAKNLKDAAARKLFEAYISAETGDSVNEEVLDALVPMLK